MSNVIELFIASHPRVIVDVGEVVATITQSARGTERVDHPPGTRRYFVDVVDDDGAIGVWDGQTYADAMIAARAASADWGNAPVIDRARA